MTITDRASAVRAIAEIIGRSSGHYSVESCANSIILELEQSGLFGYVNKKVQIKALNDELKTYSTGINRLKKICLDAGAEVYRWKYDAGNHEIETVDGREGIIGLWWRKNSKGEEVTDPLVTWDDNLYVESYSVGVFLEQFDPRFCLHLIEKLQEKEGEAP